ncbi:hypothetical protein OC846_006817 [Tilletia horrida]|uniref:Uncharacterized protein n=1 Tax=Tilletia horrida TaxID=155126 RepID=A0AAN6GI35_9BASI|nr:hypothetical protein OC845_006820 [Tilletia horrida]KAK0542179.1 hypothetical protein OC846_006817 [Tilletia horrida]KAK0557241.1 hypothetical protein OC861_007028 [Tilletia horrida]
MIDKAAASLKRRREPELYDHRMDTDSVLLAATEEVMRRFNVDSRPAHVVAQHEGGWEEIGVASSSAASSPYPQLPRLRAPLRVGLASTSRATKRRGASDRFKAVRDKIFEIGKTALPATTLLSDGSKQVLRSEVRSAARH